jgi:hypothetical protein
LYHSLELADIRIKFIISYGTSLASSPKENLLLKFGQQNVDHQCLCPRKVRESTKGPYASEKHQGERSTKRVNRTLATGARFCPLNGYEKCWEDRKGPTERWQERPLNTNQWSPVIFINQLDRWARRESGATGENT